MIQTAELIKAYHDGCALQQRLVAISDEDIADAYDALGDALQTLFRYIDRNAPMTLEQSDAFIPAHDWWPPKSE